MNFEWPKEDTSPKSCYSLVGMSRHKKYSVYAVKREPVEGKKPGNPEASFQKTFIHGSITVRSPVLNSAETLENAWLNTKFYYIQNDATLRSQLPLANLRAHFSYTLTI